MMSRSTLARRPSGRVTKDPQVRREELLDAALELSRVHGFESMNVEQVTKAAGVAKGTFYHYFASKEELAETLARRFGDSLFEHLAAAARSGTGLDRVVALMNAAASYKMEHADIAHATFLYSAGNFALRHRLFDAWRSRAREVLLPVIEAGRSDGSISVADAEAATDIVLLLWFESGDRLWLRALATDNVDDFANVMLTGAISIYQAQARILGVADDTFAFPTGPEVVQFLKQLYATTRDQEQ